jgi:hypothetical protein
VWLPPFPSIICDICNRDFVNISIINECLSLEKRNQPQAGAFLNLHIWMSAMAEANSTNLITNPNVCFCCFAG